MTTLIVSPLPIAAISAERGSGAQNLLTFPTKEVWTDTAVGSAVGFPVDLGEVRDFDTVALISVRPPAADATWSIQASENGSDYFSVLAPDTLRVPDVAGTFPLTTAALFHGASRRARRLHITVRQPAGGPLSIGRLIVGRAFKPELGKEWGSGRRPVDTGTATALASGGWAIVEGVRKRAFAWTFGDLSQDEVDQLERIALNHGETIPLLVVDEPDRKPGLAARVLYGKVDRWKAFDRRNRVQTRWELGIEQWV